MSLGAISLSASATTHRAACARPIRRAPRRLRLRVAGLVPCAALALLGLAPAWRRAAPRPLAPSSPRRVSRRGTAAHAGSGKPPAPSWPWRRLGAGWRLTTAAEGGSAAWEEAVAGAAAMRHSLNASWPSCSASAGATQAVEEEEEADKEEVVLSTAVRRGGARRGRAQAEEGRRVRRDRCGVIGRAVRVTGNVSHAVSAPILPSASDAGSVGSLVVNGSQRWVQGREACPQDQLAPMGFVPCSEVAAPASQARLRVPRARLPRLRPTGCQG